MGVFCGVTEAARSRWRRRASWTALLALVGYVLALLVAWARVWVDDDTDSTVSGDDARGAIANAHPIPPWGTGFTTYTILGSALGRQYVHRRVRDTWLDAMEAFARDTPDRELVVAETAQRGGGSFWPHHTHQRGLSIDVLVPMRDAGGARVSLSHWPWDAFGYRHELDANGRLGDLTLDAGDLARMLCLLVRRAPAHGASVRRVILAPEYHDAVSQAGDCHLGHRWMHGSPWVRHDEHVHVDFDVE